MTSPVASKISQRVNVGKFISIETNIYGYSERSVKYRCNSSCNLMLTTDKER